MSMKDLSTEEVLQKLEEFGLNVTEEEAQRFRDNEVDGETLEYGLTDNMVSYLFPGSFKKQVKFNKFIQELKDVVTLTLEQVPEECIEQPSTIESEANRRLPAGFIVPPFPGDLQTRLDNKEACLKLSRDRHRIIRVLHEAIIEYTMYPTNAEYVQVVKALIVKYPVLKDLEGNGYHTWHQSLKRKFKAERAPLVHEDEVRRSKEKFGHKRARQSTEAARTYCRSVPGVPAIIGEDASSIGRHVNILRVQYERMQPDNSIVKDCMQRTFAWRRREIADGMTVEDILKKYPFLRTPSWCDAESPYPTVQLVDNDWKMAFTRKVPVSVRVDGVDLCRGAGVEEGVIAAFCDYIVFNLAYPPYMKNTLTFLQSTMNVTVVGEKSP